MTEPKQTYQQLEQELEVWRHGPSCWSCGDSGDVHQLDGEWLGKCNCFAAQLIDVTAERDKFKAENDRLTAHIAEGMDHKAVAIQGMARLTAENEQLRKDKDRLDALESNYWDVRHNSHPIADTGDSSSSLEIVGHWMDKPFERVIGEDYNENLRAAIDQAMKAPAYPPARPEYEFDEIPDFGGGSGNKARRRAEALGIDYEAAMTSKK